MASGFVLGIDPGVIGGWAIVDGTGALISAGDLPVAGAGAQRMISAPLCFSLIEQFRPSRAIIELVSAMPKQGISSTFKFARAFGIIEGVIGGARVPVELVTPARWKKAMRLSSDKEQSRQLAIQTWPESASTFARKKDHGRAEAALIALYAVRAGLNAPKVEA